MLLEDIITIGSMAAFASFLLSVAILFSQKWHGKLSHDHDVGSIQKVHAFAVPRIGGIGIVGGLASAMFMFAYAFPNKVSQAHLHFIALLLWTSVPAFVAGIMEDITKRVSVRMRLAATVASSLLASFVLGATVDALDIWGLDGLLLYTPVAIVVTAVVVAGASNAVNIIDGFNGLSVTTIMLMAAGLGVIGWQQNDSLIMLLAALCIGASCGFFPLNYPVGKLFLGDGGAYFLGFLVAEMAVLLLVRQSEVNAWQVLGVCAYPIVEMLFSIYRRRFVQNVSPGAPDALHLHTLVFRRIVFKYVGRDPLRPWKRNASVACMIFPVVAISIAATVFFGQTTSNAMALVLIQLALYLAVYGRLVRGKWGLRRTTLPSVTEVDDIQTVS
jgi:UDP-N-acetylmuramyl pentapeptide phosphotransferase/UDP-N-acetylglucosamine-1-phosphate transferase